MAAKTKASELVVCLESFGFQDKEGGAQAFQRGTRLRGDHPVVRSHGTFFAPDGLDDVELQRLRVERGLIY